MASNKMKGLFKGLRYISQKFDSEKEPEMQIGLPTDVKHVAHIGWDGPSVNQPGWMSDFKGEESESANGDTEDRESQRSQTTTTRDLPDLPKKSRRSSTNMSAEGENLGREKSVREKPRASRRSSKSTLKASESSNAGRVSDTGLENNPEKDAIRKARRKKSKDTRDPSLTGGGVSRKTRSSSKAASLDSTLDSTSSSLGLISESKVQNEEEDGLS